MLTRCPHNGNTMHPNIQMPNIHPYGWWLRGTEMACKFYSPGLILIRSDLSKSACQWQKKKFFCMMLPWCLQDANMMCYIIFLSVSTMLPWCLQDANTMYIIFLFYVGICLSPRCYNDAHKMLNVQWTLFYLNANMDCSGWSQALSTTCKTCLILIIRSIQLGVLGKCVSF